MSPRRLAPRSAATASSTDRSGSRRRWVALAVGCLVVLAGCPLGSGSPSPTPDAASPTATPTVTPRSPPEAGTVPPGDATATDGSSMGTAASETTSREAPSPTPTSNPGGPEPEYTVTVNGGTIPFDVNRTYARTVNVTGVDPVAPPQVTVVRVDGEFQPAVEDPFAQTLVDAPATYNDTTPSVTGVLFTNPRSLPLVEAKWVLVHEFVHHLQFEYAQDSATFRRLFEAETSDGRAAAAALWEGSASYVATRYMLTYTNYSRGEILAATDPYENGSAAEKFAWDAYYFGQRYTAGHTDAAAGVWKLYDDPPTTTEQVIHGLAPGSEQPANLSVSVEGWAVRNRDRRGEMFVRSVLAAELAESRAARGADGWGSDRLVNLSTADRSAYAWTLRWDDPANATEFLAAFRAAMDERTARTDGRWVVDGTAVRVRRVAPEAVVVVTGSESFVTDARATGSNATVTIERDR